MAGPLLPFVAAGIGAKLLLWNKRGAILNHLLRKQALIIINGLETDRLRLYRSHRKDITSDPLAVVYRITCNGEDKFAPRFGIDMHLFAVAPEGAADYMVAIPATMASQTSFVKLHPADIVDADFMALMKAVRQEISKMEVEPEEGAAAGAPAAAKPTVEETPVKPKKTDKPAKVEKVAKIEASVVGDVPTNGQAEVLKAAVANPGTVLQGVSPQSIGACKRRGWIAAIGKKSGSLKEMKWQITETGIAALAASKA